MSDLTMGHLLSVIADRNTPAPRPASGPVLLASIMANPGMDAWEVLLAEGHHANVVYAQIEKAYRKGYVESGCSTRRPWLTAQGRDFLAKQRCDAP